MSRSSCAANRFLLNPDPVPRKSQTKRWLPNRARGDGEAKRHTMIDAVPCRIRANFYLLPGTRLVPLGCARRSDDVRGERAVVHFFALYAATLGSASTRPIHARTSG